MEWFDHSLQQQFLNYYQKIYIYKDMKNSITDQKQVFRWAKGIKYSKAFQKSAL